MNLNLNHLRYFWSVVREGGITKASQKLRVAQPTISAQIIALERALGRALFIRQGKRLLLTEDGDVVLDYANQVFGLTGELIEVLHGRQVEARSTVRVGVVDQISKQIVLALVKEIQAFRENTQVHIHEGSLPHMLDELRHHALDLLLSNIDIPTEEVSSFSKVEVGRLPILFVASPDVAKRAGRFPSALSRIPLLLPTHTSPIWRDVERFLSRHQISPHITAEVQGAELLRLMALEGMGAAPLNSMAVAADLRTKRLIRLNPNSTGIHKTVWLITKKRRHTSDLMLHLASRFRIRMASLGTKQVEK
jgi:LysR family transcriptional activator of nhaA